MTATLPGIGPADGIPVINRALDYGAAGLTPEEYFVLTRVDGRTSFKQLIMISGFPEARAMEILARLRKTWAILLPGEEPPKPAPPPARPATVPPAGSRPGTIPPGAPVLHRLPSPPLGVFSLESVAAEEVDLSGDQRREIFAKHVDLREADLFQVLGVEREADRKALKLAYRNLSKNFHPDRFFGKRLGSYKQMLSEIFDRASTALEVLSDPDKRDLYLASLAQSEAVPNASHRAPLTPPGGNRVQIKRQASDLFDIACAHQIAGEMKEALAGFDAAIAIDPQPRYLRRAAEAAISSQELRLAEDYVKRALELDPHNASAYRIQAKVLHLSGRRAEARLALESARKLDPENPHIVAEIRNLE